jgi:CspA family cold shock protein
LAFRARPPAWGTFRAHLAVSRQKGHIGSNQFLLRQLADTPAQAIHKIHEADTASPLRDFRVGRVSTFTEAYMATGTVKWFNAQKGYGFIQPATGGKDVFVHISALEKAGLGTLNEGQKVSYDVARDRGKEAAANLALAD